MLSRHIFLSAKANGKPKTIHKANLYHKILCPLFCVYYTTVYSVYTKGKWKSAVYSVSATVVAVAEASI